MIKKLSKQGDKLVLVLDRELLEQLQIDEQTELEITAAGRAILIAPVTGSELPPEQFDALLDSVNRRYAHTFKRLSEES